MRGLIGALAVAVAASALPAHLSAPASADPVVEHGTALPDLPAGQRAYGIALSGDTVYAGLRAYPGPAGPLTVYAAAADGTGGWTAVTDPDTAAPLQASSMPVVHGSTLLVAGPQDDQTPCNDYRLVTGSTVRALTSCALPDLTRGGLVLRTADPAGPWRIEQLDGTLVRQVTGRPFVDDGVAWTFASGTLTGTDLSTGDQIGTAHAPGSCSGQYATDVADSSALFACQGGEFGAVVDLTGQVPAWPVGYLPWQLGNGYLTRIVDVGSALTVTVLDLGAGKAERRYALGSRALFAVDHEGAPRLASLVSESTVEVSGFSLAPRATTPDDTVPPVIDSFSAPPALVRAGTDTSAYQYAWTGSDPGHPKAVFFQIHDGFRVHGSADITWNSPTGTLERTHWPSYGSLPYDGCFQVRAVDWAGNTGAWTTPACLYADGDPPQVGWVTGWQQIQPRIARTPVTVRYTGADDDKVASYDVLARVAPAGRAWGAWTAFVQRTTATAVRHAWPAGSNVCFLVRARDRAGNVGQTNLTYDSRCTTVPYDDRGLVRGSGAEPGRAAWAQNGTVTTLTGLAALTGPRTPVRSVWIAMRSRGGYCPRLWIGGRQIAAWRCQWYPIAGRAGFRYELPRTLTGRVTLRAGLHDRIRVDAVALAR